MKTKTKGTITSIFGVVFLIIATLMIVANYFIETYSFDFGNIVFMVTLGYVFLVADDDLIQWLLLKKNRDK